MKNEEYTLRLECPKCKEPLEVQILEPNLDTKIEISCEECGNEFSITTLTPKGARKMISSINSVIKRSLKGKQASEIQKKLEGFGLGLNIQSVIDIVPVSEQNLGQKVSKSDIKRERKNKNVRSKKIDEEIHLTVKDRKFLSELNISFDE